MQAKYSNIIHTDTQKLLEPFKDVLPWIVYYAVVIEKGNRQGRSKQQKNLQDKITVQRQEMKRLRIEAEEAEIKNVDMPITKSMWRMMLESTNDVCRELVKLLVEKPERLKDLPLLCLAAHKLGALPGLTLVGEAEDVNIYDSLCGYRVCPERNGEKKYC